MFGLTSLIKNTIMPSALSFAFSPLIPVPGLDKGSLWALVICFIPRILVGVTPWLIYKLGSVLARKAGTVGRGVVLVLSGIAGAMTNTILVMGLIYLLFKDAYAAVQNVPVDAVLGVVLGVVGTNGVMESIVAAVITAALCLPLIRVLKLERSAPQSISVESADPVTFS